MAEHCPERVAWDLEIMIGNRTLTGQGLTIWRLLLRSKLLPSSIFRELKDKGPENPTLLFHL